MPAVRNPSERVIANRRARVVMNRAALDALTLGMADGLQEVGERIVAAAAADAPRDPEAAARRGAPMLADTGYAATFASGKLVGGDAGLTKSQQKPRRLNVPNDQVVMVVAFRSPLAHLIELGTVKMPARPFLLPKFHALIPGAERAVPAAMVKRFKALR